MTWDQATRLAIAVNRVWGRKVYRVVGYRRPFGPRNYRWIVTAVTA